MKLISSLYAFLFVCCQTASQVEMDYFLSCALEMNDLIANTSLSIKYQ